MLRMVLAVPNGVNRGPLGGTPRSAGSALASRGLYRAFRPALLLVFLPLAVSAEERTHRLQSDLQSGETLVRTVTPSEMDGDRPLRTLYVLPVEAGSESRWGDAWAEVRRLDLADRHGLVVVLPTFSALPWYADHPSNPTLRQEEYFVEVVVPLVERHYPVVREPEGRLLVGFSKSGWGAWSLLLRHLDLFGRAAAWDAPLMQSTPDRFGMGPIFGSVENFERYRISRLLRQHASELGGSKRLVLTGYAGSFREHHIKIHALLQELEIPHVYRDGPRRDHRWGSGWLAEAVTLLLGD